MRSQKNFLRMPVVAGARRTRHTVTQSPLAFSSRLLEVPILFVYNNSTSFFFYHPKPFYSNPSSSFLVFRNKRWRRDVGLGFYPHMTLSRSWKFQPNRKMNSGFSVKAQLRLSSSPPSPSPSFALLPCYPRHGRISCKIICCDKRSSPADEKFNLNNLGRSLLDNKWKFNEIDASEPKSSF